MMEMKRTLRRASYVLGLGFVCTMLSLAPVTEIAHAKKGGYTGPGVNQGGYTGPGPKVISIRDAGNQADDTWVTLQGTIVNRMGDDKYTFQDSSGTGIVEIERKAWRGLQVGADDVVQLLVKVDKDWGSVELEVETVKIVGK